MPVGIIAFRVSNILIRSFRAHVFAATAALTLFHRFTARHLFLAEGSGELFDSGGGAD
jgi:hypothetical protein